jgi:hypothetical protein
MQTQLNNLLNNRKWTSDQFQPNEKIECSFLLNIESWWMRILTKHL